MSDLFNFEKTPDPYGVMGNPISHSKSPYIHQQFAKQTRQSIIYDAVHVDIGGFSQAVGNFIANGGKGLNITVPFKQQAFALVDALSQGAQVAGAVNTITLQADGTLFGDNTDGTGLVRDLMDNNSVTLTGKKILIVGAGGATRGIIQPLLQQSVAEIVIVNRTIQKAQDIATIFNSNKTPSDTTIVTAIGYDNLSSDARFDIIINASSASLANELPPLPSQIVQAHSCCYDMMYGATDTIFMQWAKRHGAKRVLDGLGMLVEQAAESFQIWRGVKPNTREVITRLRQELKKTVP